jgi:hypothetical protein
MAYQANMQSLRNDYPSQNNENTWQECIEIVFNKCKKTKD